MERKKLRPNYPILDFNHLGPQHLQSSELVSSDGYSVPVRNLRGKCVALYFMDLNKQSQYLEKHTWIIEFYKAVIRKQGTNFDMVFVAIPPSESDDDSVCDLLQVFNVFISTLPFASVPFQNLDWRSYLYRRYMGRYMGGYGSSINICMPSDTCDTPGLLSDILCYGPDLYPFTRDRFLQVHRQFNAFGKGVNMSLQDLLGSDSRDYLLDCHSNKVLISDLEACESIAICAFTKICTNSGPFRHQLHRIYEKFNSGGNKRFQVVLIDLMTNSSFSKEMPWLTLPFADEKTWILAHMITRDPLPGFYWDDDDFHECGPGHPFLFIKPKGESRLELYGYQIIDHFGEDAFPFTEQTVAKHSVEKLRKWTLDSFVEQADQVGLNLNRFLRYNIEKGGKEEITLSSLRENSGGIIFMSAPLDSDHLKNAMDILSQRGAELPFQVIYLTSYNVKVSSECFPNVPWWALEEYPTKSPEWREDLTEKTGNVWDFSKPFFLTFAGDATLIGAGIFKSFGNNDFPLTSDEELAKDVASCLCMNHTWWRQSLIWKLQGL